MIAKALFTKGRKIRDFSFRLHAENFGRVGYQVGKEKKENCRPLAAARPAAAMFFFVPSTWTFRAKVVYMVQRSSYLLSSKIPLQPFVC